MDILHSKIRASFQGKYLTFILMDEYYGISVNWLLQIIAIPDITTIPQVPSFFKGVINLRGKIIPVIDLRMKFGLPESSYSERTSIIIVKIYDNNDKVFIGLIVDKVLEVLDINEKDIEEPPAFGVDTNTRFILCMAKVKDIVVTLLDITKVLVDIDLKYNI